MVLDTTNTQTHNSTRGELVMVAKSAGRRNWSCKQAIVYTISKHVSYLLGLSLHRLIAPWIGTRIDDGHWWRGRVATSRLIIGAQYPSPSWSVVGLSLSEGLLFARPGAGGCCGGGRRLGSGWGGVVLRITLTLQDFDLQDVLWWLWLSSNYNYYYQTKL